MKTVLTSKTIWFGILQIAFAAVGYFAGWLTPDAALALFITGCSSIGLRFKTTQPLG